MPTRSLRAAFMTLALVLAACVVSPALAPVEARQKPAPAAPNEPQWGTIQIHDFLLNAKILSGKKTGKGITSPWKLTMSDGTVTHNAAFQTVDEHKMKNEFADGTVELNFVDSYMYDLAAYEIAKLVGLGGMMPVTVERKWQGQTGALSWWVPTKMDEGERLKSKTQPPPEVNWNDQMHRMRVFTALVYDTDRNLTNVLIDPDWKLWMIDFTRAFRLQAKLVNEKDLVKCDRQLLERIKALDAAEVARVTKDYLKKNEAESVMKRRDLIIQHFDTLVAAKGEKDVLY
ncbi:MAG: hypothetical protein HY048_10545 [Acidobacteria bacterium]|nr:hypothetical protein [Acidobacteriota bacterium]